MRRLLFLLVWVLALGLFSCTSTHQEPPAGSPAKPTAIYTGTEFPDIVIPPSMEIDQDKSMIVRTPTFVGGVLYLKGRVKGKSLIEFFKNQLTSRGWELTGSIIYRESLLAFNRPNGTCFVYISESSFNTQVEIWASEKLEQP